MSRFRSGYSESSVLSVSFGGQPMHFRCEPGGTVDLPDALDRLVPSHCPLWRVVDVAAEAAATPVPAPAPALAAKPSGGEQGKGKHGGK